MVHHSLTQRGREGLVFGKRKRPRDRPGAGVDPAILAGDVRSNHRPEREEPLPVALLRRGDEQLHSGQHLLDLPIAWHIGAVLRHGLVALLVLPRSHSGLQALLRQRLVVAAQHPTGRRQRLDHFVLDCGVPAGEGPPVVVAS